MAENLLAYAFDDNALGAPNVETTFNTLKQSLNKYKNKNDGFREMLRELVSIRDIVEKREKEFYIKLGVSDYQQLSRKIQLIENKYDDMLPNGRIMAAIRDRYDFIKDLSSATNEEIADAVEYTVNDFLTDELVNNPSSFNEVMGKALADNSDQKEDAILAYLQKFLTTKKGERFITKRGGNKVGLGKIITSYNKKTNKITASMDGVRLSSDFRKKLETELNKIIMSDREKNDNTNKKISVYSLDKKVYRDRINAIIHNYIKTPINVNMVQYDLNRSISSTIGYLGEIRATLILQELAPGMSTRGTGNLREAIKGQEIPIDIVCAANGFQIKNYTLDESNQVTFSNKLSSVTWINNRLQLTSSDISDMLITLFGIYQYNQPINPKQDKDGNIKKSPKRLDEYNNLYSNIEGLVYDLKDLYDSRIPQMMKISDQFSVDGDPMFHSKRLYFNTFFWINRHLVPASWILNKIIKSFSNNADDAISSSYHFQKDNGKMRYAYLGKQHRDKGLNYNFIDMAKRVKTEYNITIDLSEFIR